MTRIPTAGDLAADFLPHTAPFLLLDRILAIDGASGRFSKCVTTADPLVSPCGELSPLLMVEAMAQGAGIVLAAREPSLRNRSAMLAAIDQCNVTGVARAGDVLDIEITVVRRYSIVARVRGKASVGDVPCVTAAITLAFGSDTALPGQTP